MKMNELKTIISNFVNDWTEIVERVKRAWA